MPLFGLPQKQKYAYPDLSHMPGAFRLVRLLPPIYSLFGDTLRIEIITVGAETECSYDTLSYAWGTTHGDPDRRLIVESAGKEYQLFIYRPCEQALLNISTKRPLFVDQICINQNDKDERASQVKLMQDIYSNCDSVLVWLGPGTTLSNSYFDFAHKVCAGGVLGRMIGPNQTLVPQVFDATMDSSIEVTGAVREDRDDLWALFAKYDKFPVDGAIDVLGRSWFTRLWVIQELCLPPQVIFVCGSRNLCFDCFRCAVLYYTLHNTYWIGTVKGMVPKSEMAKRQEIFNLNQSLLRLHRERKSIHVRGERLPLYELVLKYNVNHETVKVRASLMDDRIFAIMGLATPQSRNSINIRYDETRPLFTELAATVAVDNPDVLLFSQFPKILSGLPSWVPDWSMDLKIPHSYLALEQPAFSAGGALQSPPTADLNSGCLTIHGLLVDTIVQVGKETMVKDLDQTMTVQADYRSVKRFADETAKLLSRSRYSHDSMAIIRLLDFGLSEKYLPDMSPARLRTIHEHALQLGQRFINSDELVQSYHYTRVVSTIEELPWFWLPVSETTALREWASKPLDALWKWSNSAVMFLVDVIGILCSSAIVRSYSAYLRFRRRFQGFERNNPDHEAALRGGGLDPEIIQSTEWGAYTDYLFKNIGRRLYLTEKGYVGTGPADIDVGDMVSILFGSTTPVVLRSSASPESGGKCKYVGETYCEGIMNGEALGGGSTIFHII